MLSNVSTLRKCRTMRESSIWAVTWPGTDPVGRGEDDDGSILETKYFRLSREMFSAELN